MDQAIAIDEYWPRWQVERVTSLSRATLYRKSKAGSFPAPCRISDNRVAWVAAEVRAWMASKTEARA